MVQHHAWWKVFRRLPIYDWKSKIQFISWMYERSSIKQIFSTQLIFIWADLVWKIFFGFWLLFLFFTPVPKKIVHQSHSTHTHILHPAVGQICNLVTMNALLIVLVIKQAMTGPKVTQLMMKTTARAIHNLSLKVVSSMLKKIIK